MNRLIVRHSSLMKSPDPSNDPPAAFLARMRELLPPGEFDAFLAAFEQPPRVGLRVNTLKISVADFISIAPFSLAPVGDWEPAGFIVTSDGEVKNPIVTKSSHPEFEAPALESVQQWKFDPGWKAGRAVNTRMSVPIVFTLNEDDSDWF